MGHISRPAVTAAAKATYAVNHVEITVPMGDEALFHYITMPATR